MAQVWTFIVVLLFLCGLMVIVLGLQDKYVSRPFYARIAARAAARHPPKPWMPTAEEIMTPGPFLARPFRTAKWFFLAGLALLLAFLVISVVVQLTRAVVT